MSIYRNKIESTIEVNSLFILFIFKIKFIQVPPYDKIALN